MHYSKKDKEEVFEKILSRIENGEALRRVLKDSGYPNASTFYEWIDDDETLAKRYARATQARAEMMEAEILAIADYSANDTDLIIKGDMPIEVENREWINRSRLRIDSRKWLMAKMFPKKYGDKIEVENSGNVVIDFTS